MNSISYMLNTYILPEIHSTNIDDIKKPYFSRPIKEMLVDPLRMVIGGKNCCQVFIFGDKAERIANKDLDLSSRMIRLIIYAQLGIPSFLNFMQSMYAKDTTVKKNETWLLTLGIVYHIGFVILAQLTYLRYQSGNIIKHTTSETEDFILSALLGTLGLYCSSSDKPIVNLFGYLTTLVSVGRFLHKPFHESKTRAMVEVAFISFGTAKNILATLSNGMTLKVYICRTCAILVGSVALGIFLKLATRLLHSSVREGHSLYCKKLQTEQNNQLVVNNEIKFREVDLAKITNFTLNKDVFINILNYCSLSTIVRIRLCHKIFSLFIPLDYVFHRTMNVLPFKLEQTYIQCHPLKNTLIKSIESNRDNTRDQCLNSYLEINEHLGTERSVTWGIDTEDNVFLCFQVQKIFRPESAQLKSQNIFKNFHYIVLRVNDDADSSVPWIKNIKIIGEKSYVGEILNEPASLTGWHLLTSLTEELQIKYWTDMFTGHLSRSLKGNPPREINSRLYALTNY